MVPLTRGRPLVLTFDAFGTLFHPCRPIGQQYAEAARMHGLSGFTDKDIEASFPKAFRYERKRYPNYGKAMGLDATQWWSNVIKSTFCAVLPSSAKVPESLITSLIRRFSTNEGYKLYDDVKPFFERLHDWRRGTNTASTGNSRRVHVGIISNSDGRVSTILGSHGIRVNDRRYCSGTLVGSHGTFDIDSVTLSYDVGFEKPHRMIFDAARSLSRFATESDTLCLHIGDSLSDDYHGAREAGWDSVLLDRDSNHTSGGSRAVCMADLNSLMMTLKERV